MPVDLPMGRMSGILSMFPFSFDPAISPRIGRVVLSFPFGFCGFACAFVPATRGATLALDLGPYRLLFGSYCGHSP